MTSRPAAGRGEHEALARLSRILPGPPEGEIWVGDDAAVVEVPAGPPLLLLAADTVVAGLDADLSLTTLADLGWKAMAVNLSDIAAMGGRPAHALVSVVGLGPDELEELYEGITEAAAEFGCPVVGGDLSAGHEVVVSVAITGWADGWPVLRSGAGPGDSIWVTSPLGAAAAGLRLLKEAGPGPHAWGAAEHALVRAHARPRPALREGLAARQVGATAMIDVSDGLAADLHKLATLSGVGFELTGVPVAEGATVDEALAGGDDYVLVLTTPAGVEVVEAFLAADVPAPYLIGECVADPKLRRVAGQTLKVAGWEHAL
jgi:thiamine-monophosphate kinase